MIIYLSNENIEKKGSGVNKKIKGQINTFNKSGLDCKYKYFPFVNEFHNNVIDKIARRLPFFPLYRNLNIDDEYKNAKAIYVRHILLDRSAIRFFKKVRHYNPTCKIVWEFPTYPYDQEMKKYVRMWPFYIKDLLNRNLLKEFVDYAAILTNEDEVFGIKTLKISNGIVFSEVRSRKITIKGGDEIHLIAVAQFAWWHGYDRFIEGMKIYYASNPSRKMIFHLVGHGSEFGRYQKMVAEYGLREYVIFHGQQTGEALDAIYDQCNLGIASLGFHRTGLTEGAPLKTREYLAKGLPFVFGAKVSDISDEDKDNIYLQVPANDSPIDIGSILEFYDRIYSEGAEQVNTRLRQFAKDHFSMEVAMKEVIDFFKDGK